MDGIPDFLAQPTDSAVRRQNGLCANGPQTRQKILPGENDISVALSFLAMLTMAFSINGTVETQPCALVQGFSQWKKSPATLLIPNPHSFRVFGVVRG
jgi:hypothetical protein